MQQTMTGGPELPFTLHAIHSTREGLYIKPDVLKLNYRSLNYAARDRERVRAGETIVWENAKICIQQVAAHFKWPWSWRPKLAQHACCSPPPLSLPTPLLSSPHSCPRMHLYKAGHATVTCFVVALASIWPVNQSFFTFARSQSQSLSPCLPFTVRLCKFVCMFMGWEWAW